MRSGAYYISDALLASEIRRDVLCPDILLIQEIVWCGAWPLSPYAGFDIHISI